jgi:nucleoside-diphosphate-sugar epimerase
VNVLILGGSGTIGSAVVDALIERQHEVVALARSPAAVARLSARGIHVVAGDIRNPVAWIGAVDSAEAIVHVAGDFQPDAGVVDRVLMEMLLPRLCGKSFVYTGGCWLYGDTGAQVATEESAFQPPSAWAWMLDPIGRVRGDRSMRGIVIHPAMVYERDGGVFAAYRRDIDAIGRVRVIGREDVRWPLVHRRDIGELYALALERGVSGAAYNGAGIESIPVGVIAQAMARRLGVPHTPLIRSADEVAAEWGEWARGYALDQRMSGDKARRELGWVPHHTDPVADVS